MKLIVLVFMGLSLSNYVSSASFYHGVYNKTKYATYENIYIEAVNRMVKIYEIDSAHRCEEIYRLHTKLPIRSIFVYQSKSKTYLNVSCRIGSIIRECVYCIDNPIIPDRIS